MGEIDIIAAVQLFAVGVAAIAIGGTIGVVLVHFWEALADWLDEFF